MNDDWKKWLHVLGTGEVGSYGRYIPLRFQVAWTMQELAMLAVGIKMAQGALSEVGIDWKETPLAEFRFKKGNYDMALGRTITLANVNYQTIWHEMGHAIDAGFGKELHDIFDEVSGNCGLLFCNRTARDDYYYSMVVLPIIADGGDWDLFMVYLPGKVKHGQMLSRPGFTI